MRSGIGIPNAHYKRRSQGGLGIKENVVTLCPVCHGDYDDGDYREEYELLIYTYLIEKYPYLTEELITYKKGDTKV